MSSRDARHVGQSEFECSDAACGAPELTKKSLSLLQFGNLKNYKKIKKEITIILNLVIFFSSMKVM